MRDRKRKAQPTDPGQRQQLAPAQAKLDAKVANEALLKKAEKAQPKATLRNRLYADFGKKRQRDLDSEAESSESPAKQPRLELEQRDEGNASDLASQETREAKTADWVESVSQEEGGIARKLEIMFAGARLSALLADSCLQLPVVDTSLVSVRPDL